MDGAVHYHRLSSVLLRRLEMAAPIAASRALLEVNGLALDLMREMEAGNRLADAEHSSSGRLNFGIYVYTEKSREVT